MTVGITELPPEGMQLGGVALAGDAERGTKTTEGLSLLFTTAGITVQGPQPQIERLLVWSGLDSASCREKIALPDGRNAAVMELTSGGQSIRFLLPMDAVTPGQAAYLDQALPAWLARYKGSVVPIAPPRSPAAPPPAPAHARSNGGSSSSGSQRSGEGSRTDVIAPAGAEAPAARGLTPAEAAAATAAAAGAAGRRRVPTAPPGARQTRVRARRRRRSDPRGRLAHRSGVDADAPGSVGVLVRRPVEHRVRASVGRRAGIGTAYPRSASPCRGTSRRRSRRHRRVGPVQRGGERGRGIGEPAGGWGAEPGDRRSGQKAQGLAQEPPRLRPVLRSVLRSATRSAALRFLRAVAPAGRAARRPRPPRTGRLVAAARPRRPGRARHAGTHCLEAADRPVDR